MEQEKPNRKSLDKKKIRANRLKAALKENMAKRKVQTRGRNNLKVAALDNDTSRE